MTGPKQEKCNATWSGIDGDKTFRCCKDAGHWPVYHETEHQRQLWWDDAGGAKPHVWKGKITNHDS